MDVLHILLDFPFLEPVMTSSAIVFKHWLMALTEVQIFFFYTKVHKK